MSCLNVRRNCVIGFDCEKHYSLFTLSVQTYAELRDQEGCMRIIFSFVQFRPLSLRMGAAEC